MSFKDKIAGAFGSVDKKFAGHPNDLERAGELLVACVKEKISLEDLLRAVEEYLKASGASSEHIQTELSKVKKKFSAWLD